MPFPESAGECQSAQDVAAARQQPIAFLASPPSGSAQFPPDYTTAVSTGARRRCTIPTEEHTPSNSQPVANGSRAESRDVADTVGVNVQTSLETTFLDKISVVPF